MFPQDTSLMVRLKLFMRECRFSFAGVGGQVSEGQMFMSEMVFAGWICIPTRRAWGLRTTVEILEIIINNFPGGEPPYSRFKISQCHMICLFEFFSTLE